DIDMEVGEVRYLIQASRELRLALGVVLVEQVEAASVMSELAVAVLERPPGDERRVPHHHHQVVRLGPQAATRPELAAEHHLEVAHRADVAGRVGEGTLRTDGHQATPCDERLAHFPEKCATLFMDREAS